MTASGTARRLVVVGAGPAGYPAAFYAADLGMDVTLVDTRADPGGVCLYCGCIPSKALLHAAGLIAETRAAGAMGLSFAAPTVDLDALRGWKHRVVRKLTGGLGQLRKGRKVRMLQGRARFASPSRLVVRTAEGKEETPAFDVALLATGSRPVQVPGFPVDAPRVMDSTGALALPDVPERMLVVGGGYIGLELGTVYAALGARVSVVEMLPGLLPGADRDLVAPVARRAEAAFESILLETRVAGVRAGESDVEVKLAGKDGGERTEVYERVLVAVGRRPNTEDLGLEAAGVAVDGRGFVQVDGARRTTEPRVFAAGDVAGEPMLAHKATHEARLAVEAIAGRRAAFEPRAIPAVVFTDPEIAWCGLTEAEAKSSGRPVRVARFPWSASGRALTLDRTEGLTKLLADADSGRVLGVGISGPHAGDLIAEGALAIEMGATVEDLALTIHPHPTLSETLMEAAEAYLGHCTHLAPATRPTGRK